MNTCPICVKRRKPLQFGPINYTPDEKLAFVERVCGILIQSRYGMDRSYENLVGPRCEIDSDRAVFFDNETKFTPSFRTSIYHRLLEKIKTTASLFGEKLKNSGTQHRSPSTLGRGSPGVSFCERSLKIVKKQDFGFQLQRSDMFIETGNHKSYKSSVGAACY